MHSKEVRCLNEPIARRANVEDNCTGRFWEGRFKLQALLDDAARLACMAYVDLNPIRANLASTPEESNHTSIKLRIQAALSGKQPKTLLPLTGNEHKNQLYGINFSLQDYLELVDNTGRIIRNDKHGFISDNAKNVLTALNMSQDNWLKLTQKFDILFHGPVGSLQEITLYCDHLNKRRRHFSSASQYFKTG